MRPVDSGSAPTYVPPPPPPPPVKHTVAAGDTVASIASAHQTTPAAVAQANYIKPDAVLTPGQQLTIPPPNVVVADYRQEPPSAPAQTPAQRTDAAVKNYQDVVAKGGNAAAVADARSQVDSAVSAEIQSEVTKRNAGVPAQFQTPSEQIIQQWGDAILKRVGDNPAAQAVVKAAVADKQLQAKADALIPGFSGPWTAREKLHEVGLALKGQPQDVIDRVTADPRVQGWIKDATAEIGEPYNGVADGDLDTAELQAPEAAKRLADTVVDLPPQLATQVMQQSLPTIQKIAQCEMIYGGTPAYQSVMKAVGAMGDSPQAKALTQQIAQAYVPQVEKWEGFTYEATQSAVGQGASPALAVELAGQLKAAGKTDQASGVLNAAAAGVQTLQGTLKNDLKDYAELTKDLNWLVKNASANLTPDQQQKAIDAYIQSKGPDFQRELDEAQSKIVSDVAALKTDVAQLEGLPADLEAAAPAVHSIIGSVLEDDQVQSAIAFAANRDPGVFEGAEGGKFAEVLTELGHKSKDLLPAVAKAYVSGNVLPALSALNPNDPASIAKANRVLDDFQAKASKLFGIPQNEVDAGVKDLRKVVQTLQTTKSIDVAIKNIHELDTLKQELGELKDTPFSSGAAATAFRTVALGLSGAALLNSGAKTIEDPSAQNAIGTLAYSVGLAQDTAGFGASVQLLDSEGALGKWGLAQGIAGEATEKFIGALNIAYFAVGAGSDISSGNVPKAIFDVAGAGGAALATFGEAVGLGSWAGPVGVGVTVLATAGIALVEWKQEQNEHSEAAETYYKGAGLDEAVAKTLSHDATDESNRLRGDLGLSPAQVQELAEKHPEVFGAPGYAQAVVDVAKANGISAENLTPFLDAVAKDDPNYMDTFFSLKSADNGMSPLTHQTLLVDSIQNRFPTAAQFVREHSPQLFGADASERRKADQQYESTSSASNDPAAIANLLKNDSNPAYQAELVKVMKDNGMLDAWTRQIGSSYHYNGWPEVARSAVQAAQSAGVLSPQDAQKYLAQIG